MSPAPRSYCELVPVRITIGFPPEREPFTTGWGKNFALEKRIYFIDRMDNVAAYRRIMRKEPSRGWGGERQTHAPADGQEKPFVRQGAVHRPYRRNRAAKEARGREAIRAFSALFRGIAQNHSWYCAQGPQG